MKIPKKLEVCYNTRYVWVPIRWEVDENGPIAYAIRCMEMTPKIKALRVITDSGSEYSIKRRNS